MSVPVALPSIGSYLTAIPVGAALAELGTNCGAQARARGCNVQTFATVELLVTALLMTWLQICLVLVVRHYGSSRRGSSPGCGQAGQGTGSEVCSYE